MIENEENKIIAVAQERFSSRKFLVTVATLLVSTGALFLGFLDGDQFVDIIPMILAIYGAGNVAEYFTAMKRK